MIFNGSSEYVVQEIQANSMDDEKILDACIDDDDGTNEEILVYELVGYFQNNPTVVPIVGDKKCK
jgi:hypothetical protein